MNVWVTRDETPDGPLSQALRQLGVNPIVEPVIHRRIEPDSTDAVCPLTPRDWLILTSPFVVRCLPSSMPRNVRVAAVGPSTARSAKLAGFDVAIVSRDRNRADLLEQLKRVARDCLVCHPRSDRARPIPAWPSVQLQSPIVYTTMPREFDGRVVDRVDLITVTSPSAVQALGPTGKPFASIGATTTAALRGLGIEPVIQPDQPSLGALARAVADYGSVGRTDEGAAGSADPPNQPA